MSNLSRRDFMRGSACLAAATSVGMLNARTQAQDRPNANTGGANERLNIACIGVRGQGMNHVRGYANRHNCVVAMICDTDTSVVGRAVDAARQAQGSEPRVVQDLRRVMDDPSIHAVSIATPNHWH